MLCEGENVTWLYTTVKEKTPPLHFSPSGECYPSPLEEATGNQCHGYINIITRSPAPTPRATLLSMTTEGGKQEVDFSVIIPSLGVNSIVLRKGKSPKRQFPVGGRVTPQHVTVCITSKKRNLVPEQLTSWRCLQF